MMMIWKLRQWEESIHFLEKDVGDVNLKTIKDRGAQLLE